MSLALVRVGSGGIGRNDDTPPDFFVKPCCQLHKRSFQLIVSACMGGTRTETKGVGNYMGACAQMCRYSWPFFLEQHAKKKEKKP